MPICKSCGDEVDELQPVRVAGRIKRLCEDCVELAEEEAQIAEESEAAMQGMMGYRGRG